MENTTEVARSNGGGGQAGHFRKSQMVAAMVVKQIYVKVTTQTPHTGEFGYMLTTL